MTTELGMKDEFDLLLDDVLRSVANPELPERVGVQVRTRVWIAKPKQSEVVFAPEIFLARMQPRRPARSAAFALLAHAAAIALIFWLRPYGAKSTTGAGTPTQLSQEVHA